MVGAVLLVAPVLAVVVPVAAPQLRDADPVVALEIALGAFPRLAAQLVRAVPTLGLSVANPALRDAPVPVLALEPVRPAPGLQLALVLVGAV